MRKSMIRDFVPARISGPALFLSVTMALLSPCSAQGAGPTGGDHQAAAAALSDVKVAITAIVAADASYATDRNVYHRASQRAINALEGTKGPDYKADAGTPGDPEGAIGHIDALLDRAATPIWAAPLHGAEANLRAAVAYLRDSIATRELMDYQLRMSRALAYLEVAQGRPTETGVLAGLEGAVANTELGVPAGAREVDGCAEPGDAPAFGTHNGYIAWITIPASDGVHHLAEPHGGRDITVRNGVIVLHTAAAAIVARECGTHAAVTPAVSTAAKPVAALSTGGLPALYTVAQARIGAQVYASKCVSCHGANMQGVAAPSVAGDDFLKTAKNDGWTLEIIRYLVFTMMPKNAGGSLSLENYAAVMAYLLASNCYPAGNAPFPTADNADFAKVRLGPVTGNPGNQNSQGVCPLP
ncbi:MAG: c-type cytochrome [Acetobacteraceae bacterium]